MDFLGKVEAWLLIEVARVYAVRDNRQAHPAIDVLLSEAGHPCWEFELQPNQLAFQYQSEA